MYDSDDKLKVNHHWWWSLSCGMYYLIIETRPQAEEQEQRKWKAQVLMDQSEVHTYTWWFYENTDINVAICALQSLFYWCYIKVISCLDRTILSQFQFFLRHQLLSTTIVDCHYATQSVPWVVLRKKGIKQHILNILNERWWRARGGHSYSVVCKIIYHYVYNNWSCIC